MPRVPHRAADLAGDQNMMSKRLGCNDKPGAAPSATRRVVVRKVITKPAPRPGLRVRQTLLQLAQRMGFGSVARSRAASPSAPAISAALRAPAQQSQVAVIKTKQITATAQSAVASTTVPAQSPSLPLPPRSWSLPATTSSMSPPVLSLVSPSPVPNLDLAKGGALPDRGIDNLFCSSAASTLLRRGNVHTDDVDFHYGVLLPSLRVAERGLCSATAAAAVSLASLALSRRVIVDWMARCHDHFGLVTATLFLAVRLLDAVLLRVHTPEGQRVVQNPTLLGAVTLLLASKFEEEDYPAPYDLANFSGGHFVAEDVQFMEVLVFEVLGHRLHMPTAFHHLHWCIEVEISRFETTRGKLVQYLAELALRCEDSSLWAPSDFAAAALATSTFLFSRHPALSMVGDGMLQGDAASPEALCAPGCLVRRILGELKGATAGVAAFDKFATPCRGGVASLAARLARGDPIDV
eukprot:TRINITY_DN10256_c0_g2_i1.p1 TRINITY_DN10256_c0_g2~~TRINITY_DN10256_c0_g2_i1.p1  ORF type:complete len:465 (+),score=84.08 TRINITY_DN10256_c0_g2_i1:82-1476(+)